MGHIYQIRNIENDKVYIGSSKDTKAREWNHWNELKNNRHCNSYLQNVYNKYGKDSLRFEILYECDNSKLAQQEQDELSRFIVNNNIDHNFCYNISTDCVRYAMSKETREKCSQSFKNYLRNNPHPKKGKKNSPETRAKLRTANLGKKHSPERIRKMAETKRINNATPEARQKYREASLKRNYKHTPEMIEFLKSQRHTEERKRKISDSLKGKKKSRESIAKRLATLAKRKMDKISSEDNK